MSAHKHGQLPRQRVRAFLSCSVRARDRPLVDALARYVLAPRGFDCFTIGTNVSRPDQVDDAIRDVIARSDCLIGVALPRSQSRDLDFPDQNLVHATPYLLQETAAAHQLALPWLICRSPEVELQGVTARNLYLDIDPALTDRGRVRFKESRALVQSSLDDLHSRALARQAQRKRQTGWDTVRTGATIGAGIVLGAKVLDWWSRPNCFGQFYYKAPECRGCDFKGTCKVEKARLAT